MIFFLMSAQINFSLRNDKIKLMALGAKILRPGMLMMTEIAVGIRPVMRRFVRIARFDFRRFFGQLRRCAVTGQALGHFHRSRFLYFAVALCALHTFKSMQVAARNLAL
jgi:hypothetical protein